MNKNKLLFMIINIIVALLLSIFFSNFTILVINSILLLILHIVLFKCDDKIYKHLMIIYLIELFGNQKVNNRV